jgi:cholesterol transport system auxiliary component
MKIISPKLLLILFGALIASSLTACVSVNKTKQSLVIYDFGLSVSSESNKQITSTMLLEKPVAADAINHHKLRYRLNYQNPSRIFFYTESRWATSPSELLSSKISQMVNFANAPTNCHLKLKIEAFDHVFQTATDSFGVVQLSAVVIEKSTQKTIANQLITEEVISTSSNAQGGAMAIQSASEAALKKAIEWGNMVLDSNERCL